MPDAARSARRRCLACASAADAPWQCRLSIADKKVIQAAIREHIEAGATLHTDEYGAYVGVENSGYAHATVNHGDGEYVRDGVTTNGIESVFAVLSAACMASITTPAQSIWTATLTSFRSPE